MTAHQLAPFGVIHQIAPAGTVLTCAHALAESLSQTPAHVLTSIKELVNDAQHLALPEQLAREKQHFLVNLTQPAAGEAIQQFLQRKRP